MTCPCPPAPFVRPPRAGDGRLATATSPDACAAMGAERRPRLFKDEPPQGCPGRPQEGRGQRGRGRALQPGFQVPEARGGARTWAAPAPESGSRAVPGGERWGGGREPPQSRGGWGRGAVQPTLAPPPPPPPSGPAGASGGARTRPRRRKPGRAGPGPGARGPGPVPAAGAAFRGGLGGGASAPRMGKLGPGRHPRRRRLCFSTED